jgi:hypothetical protein
MEVEYTYPDLGTVVMSFYDGMLGYRWIAGPQAGVEIRDRIYQSRQIRDGLYLVSWHDPENHNFAALLFDLQEEREYAAVIGGYGTGRRSRIVRRISPPTGNPRAVTVHEVDEELRTVDQFCESQRCFGRKPGHRSSTG